MPIDHDENDDKTTPFIRGEIPARSAVPATPYRSPGVVSEAGGGGMFGSYAEAKKRKAPTWAKPLLTAILVGHLGFFFVLYVQGIWSIEQLEPPTSSSSISIAPPPPPPPPPPPGGKKPQHIDLKPKKPKVKDLVQPVKMEKQEVVAETETENVGGEEGGEEGGVEGGVVGGVVGAPPPPPPPPPPAPPQNIAPTMLEQSRIAGEKQIVPDDNTKVEIQRSGKDKVVGSYKICINPEGGVTSVTQIKSTGFPAYDSKIQRKMRNEWRYRPFLVNGKAAPVCTAVTFIYSQR
ncbi:MAG: energy transducer TonB [Kofleriaceae bacterium]